ncbi:hypothetical protein Tco_1466246 [Tanacetum coccineum]
MDDDLFTYEVEIPGLANIPCDLKEEVDSKQRVTYGSDADMEYDISNVEFAEWKIRYLNGIKTYYGYMKNHGQTMEYGKNPLLLNIIVNYSHLRVDIRNGQLVARKMTDIVMTGTCMEHTELGTHYDVKI